MSNVEPQVEPQVEPKKEEPVDIMPEEEVELDETHASGIVLHKIEVKNSEELEEEVFSDRSALYRFSEEDKDWKERARGDLKILKHKETGKYRVLMRAENILKVRLNHQVGDVTLKPNAGSDKAWTWRWKDYATDSGEPEVHSFAVRFRTKEIAEKFNQVWEVGRAANKSADSVVTDAAATDAATPAAATEEPHAEEAKPEEKTE